MKKFIYRYKIILTSVVAAIIFSFFFLPFIFVYDACPPGEIQGLCAFHSVPISLLMYLQNKEPNTEVYWSQFFFNSLITFILFYVILNLLIKLRGLKKRKQTRSVKVKYSK